MVACIAALILAGTADASAPGPHQVGRALMDLDDVRVGLPGLEAPRTLRCDVWYPAPYRKKLPEWTTYGSKHVEEVGPARGCWPVVLFSHGLAAWNTQCDSLCRHWASHGFVVLAVDHPGSWEYPFIFENARALAPSIQHFHKPLGLPR